MAARQLPTLRDVFLDEHAEAVHSVFIALGLHSRLAREYATIPPSDTAEGSEMPGVEGAFVAMMRPERASAYAVGERYADVNPTRRPSHLLLPPPVSEGGMVAYFASNLLCSPNAIDTE